MLRFPDCKINLGLHITSRREDGYHNLETVFYPVPFYDVLELIPAGDTQLSLSGLAVAGDMSTNLVWKAYQLLKGQFPGKIPAFHIYLHKVIPMGAGLGGGSADGAFMLEMINDYCGLGLNKEALAAYALQLGSDCPFFIYNTPQYASGRGEKMEPIKLDLSGYDLQLVCPQVHVSTSAAFKMIRPGPASFDLRKLGDLPVTQWKDNIKNDFEQSVFQQYPQLAAIKQQFYDAGAVYAAMSGSGSSIFGIFEKGRKALVDGEHSFLLHL